MKNTKTRFTKYLFIILAVVELCAELLRYREFIFILRIFLLPSLLLYYTLSVGGNWNIQHRLMIIAIFFSWVGDMSLVLTPEHPLDFEVLGIPKNKYLFIAGVAGFLISHLFFIGAYRQSKSKAWLSLFSKSKWPFVLIALYGVGMVAVVVPKVYADPEKSIAAFPVLIYAGILCSMVAFALNRYGRVSTVSFWWVMVGSLLFLFSDSLIALNFLAFPRLIPYPGFWIMLTFLSAEFLIAKGVLKDYDATI